MIFKQSILYSLFMLFVTLGFCKASDGVATHDSLLNKTIYARQINEVRIKLGSTCSPCKVYWNAEGQGKVLISNLYGPANDTIKIQYDFQHFNSLKNSIQLYEGHYLRSNLPFIMDYPIPESIARPHNAGSITRAVRVGKDGINILGRPFVSGWRVGK